MLASCGGGGGGGGDSTHTPTISNLQFSPTSVYQFEGNGTTTLTGSFDFSDKGGDLAKLTITEPGGGELTDDIQDVAGSKTGTILGEFEIDTTTAGTFDFQIYVTDSGGLRSNALSGTIRVAPFPWTTKAAPTIAREYAGVAALNGRLYVVGGERTDQGVVPGPVTNTVQVYDPQTDAWSNAPSMPTARRGLVVVASGGRLYAIGGSTDSGASTDVVEEFDPGTQMWTSLAAMPTARHFAAAALVGGRIVVAGGRTQATDVLATVESFDPLANSWTTLAAMPTPRRELAGVESGGRLFAIGGYAGLLPQWVATVEAYDPVTNTWTTRASMATARSHLALAVVNDRVIAAGGENVARALDALETYDPVGNAWTGRTQSPVVFTRAGVGVVNDRVYVSGNGLTLEYVPANDIR